MSFPTSNTIPIKETSILERSSDAIAPSVAHVYYTAMNPFGAGYSLRYL